jgi:hypothetical protein
MILKFFQDTYLSLSGIFLFLFVSFEVFVWFVVSIMFPDLLILTFLNDYYHNIEFFRIFI